MKLNTLIFIILAIGILAKNSKTGHKKANHKSHRQNGGVDSQSSVAQASFPSLQPAHISETFYGGNPNTLPKDRHFLWKDFKNNQYGRPFYHGVVGPQWRVPVPESDSPYKTISSPIPGGDYHNRIIANDLPLNTHSHTSWEMPKRKDVVQIDLPQSSVHSFEKYVDPRFPPKSEVQTVPGTQYHNTGSTNPQLNFGNNSNPTAQGPQTSNGEFSFSEKNSKKKKNHLRKRSHLKNKTRDEDIDLRSASISQAQAAHDKAYKLLYSVTAHPEINDGSMPLDIEMKNRRDLSYRTKNQELENTIEFWKLQPQGIRGMHTKPFIPKA